MPKQIAVFMDGTGNNGRLDGPKQTNVYKLYLEVKKSRLHIKRGTPLSPCVCYIRGIGTDPKPLIGIIPRGRAWIGKKYDQGLGAGATARLKGAYNFISHHYEPGDQIFLFGFSRGAFLTKILAGFLGRVGLLFRHPPPGCTVEQAFWLYWADYDGRAFTKFLRQVLPVAVGVEGIHTHFLGQWDAVESMDLSGISAESEKLLCEIAARERTKPLPYWIDHARHAIALHEVREQFEPLLWSGVSRKPPPSKIPTFKPQTLEQVWFAGAHADVGGGYKPGDGAGTRYSDISLRWMWCQAIVAGLSLPEPPCYAPPAPLDVPHTPSKFYFLLGAWPARVRPALVELAMAPRDGEYLHSSVLKRIWQPIEDGYASANNAMRLAWRDADEAALRFHYRLRFGSTTPPALSPIGLQVAAVQRAVRMLEDFLEGKTIFTDEILVKYGSLALAFKAPLLKRYATRSAFVAVPAERISALATVLNALFVEPDVHTLWKDWRCQQRTLRYLALELKAPDKTNPGPEEVSKL